MKLLLAATGSLALACAAPAMAQNVEALPDGPRSVGQCLDILGHGRCGAGERQRSGCGEQ